ncbi:MAG: methylenetetrahydrofolate reductase [Leptospiraceae bacterium]|nr:MAG: methylenetetrahydrofolate reductase [Leptospiraceae bacterium]
MKKIAEILKNKKPTFSFEFFPPKTEEGEYKLEESIKELKQLKPDFVSVTYGAGGSTRLKTDEWVRKIQNQYNLISMAHLTCVGSNREEIKKILEEHKNHQITNIMALRGDPPKDQTHFIPVKNGFRYASELIQFIREEFKDEFSIGAACYPEKHPEAKTLEEDIEHLKIKVEKGVDFLVSQLFFDNQKFFRFRDKIRNKNIHIPLIAGIMPITAYKQIERFTQMANCSIPLELVEKMEKFQNQQEELLKISIEFSVKQCEELLKNQVDGIHFYTLNQSNATFLILNELYKIFNMSVTQ